MLQRLGFSDCLKMWDIHLGSTYPNLRSLSLEHSHQGHVDFASEIAGQLTSLCVDDASTLVAANFTRLRALDFREDITGSDPFLSAVPSPIQYLRVERAWHAAFDLLVDEADHARDFIASHLANTTDGCFETLRTLRLPSACSEDPTIEDELDRKSVV